VSDTHAPSAAPAGFDRVAPLLFVPLWATGFAVVRLVAPHADPLTFLAIRFGLSAGLLAGLAAAAGVAWPGGAGGGVVG